MISRNPAMPRSESKIEQPGAERKAIVADFGLSVSY